MLICGLCGSIFENPSELRSHSNKGSICIQSDTINPNNFDLLTELQNCVVKQNRDKMMLLLELCPLEEYSSIFVYLDINSHLPLNVKEFLISCLKNFYKKTCLDILDILDTKDEKDNIRANKSLVKIKNIFELHEINDL